jgi:hypothetical protein
MHEELDTIRTNLKGARIVYEERSRNLKSVLEQIGDIADVKAMFNGKDHDSLQDILLQLGKKNTHAEILIAVDSNQKVLSRRNGTNKIYVNTA